MIHLGQVMNEITGDSHALMFLTQIANLHILNLFLCSLYLNHAEDPGVVREPWSFVCEQITKDSKPPADRDRREDFAALFCKRGIWTIWDGQYLLGPMQTDR